MVQLMQMGWRLQLLLVLVLQPPMAVLEQETPDRMQALQLVDRHQELLDLLVLPWGLPL